MNQPNPRWGDHGPELVPLPDNPYARPAAPNGMRPRANAGNLDIAAFILAWFIPPVGAIMGHVAQGQAKRAGFRPCALSTWAIVLGWLWFAVGATFFVVFIISFAAAVSQNSGY